MSGWQDVRYAARSIRKSPGFAAVAIVTLALGIGATTIIFSVVDGILINPFPYKDADRLTSFFIHDPARPKENGNSVFPMAQFMEYRDGNHVFEDMMGNGFVDVLYTANGETQLFNGAWVTPNMMDFLGVAPLVGRSIAADDVRPDTPPIAVMSYRAWNERFNRDPALIGQTLMLNNMARTLVAIMPPRFLPGNADFWFPVAFSGSAVQADGGLPLFLVARGRLKRGVTLEAAAADLTPIATRLARENPRDYPKQFTVVARNFADSVVGDFKGMLYALVAAVALVLLIACSNVANLLLARATTREREIAIRASLGAGRARLISQLVAESLLLSLLGCALGCLLALVGLKGVVAMIPPNRISATSVIELSPFALIFAVLVSLVTTILCGWAPAFHAVRGELSARLAGGGKGTGAGFRHGRLRAGLVVFEVALSILLLVGAGLMMRTLFALQNVDLGFNPRNILSIRLPFPKGRYETAEQKRIFFTQLLDRVTALPGVVAATATSSLPPYGGIRSDVTVPGKTHTERWQALVQLSSEGWVTTLGLRLTRGRMISRADIDGARRVAVVNELLARSFFSSEDPIGRRVKFDFFDRFPDTPHDAYFEIVGVVADARNQGLQDPAIPEAFLPFNVTGLFNRGVLIRTAMAPASLVSSVRREIFAIDRGVALAPPTGALEDSLRDISYSGPEFGMTTFGAFAGIGLVLVIVGVFSVMAYAVSLQTHEIGVRMALGAQRSDILRMVLRNGLTLVAIGSVIGVAASAALARVMASQIWGVSPTDPATLGVVVLTVLVVGLVACVFPARSATRVDPLIALRYD
jgi:putative ABC transport system permease protein